ncbi:hypothetical protein [Nannocystis pusilla]|uniref:hypothetical protein n=1 Tax=Nannocystis pusilla TaxID=889268 RepID=UPI003BEF93C4
MPGRLRASQGALVLLFGAAAGCFNEDFMLGAWCDNDVQCGESQCCAGHRCRPAPDFCDRGAGIDTSFEYAYRACQRDADCLEYGMPHCVHFMAAADGFCADQCLGVAINCEAHPESASRTCLAMDGQEHCALRCCSAGCEADTDGSTCAGQECPAPCPDHMECLADVCVPKASS